MGRGALEATGGPPILSSYGKEPMYAHWDPMHSRAWSANLMSLDSHTARQSRPAPNPYRYRDGRLRPDRPALFSGVILPPSPRIALATGQRTNEVLVPNSGLPSLGTMASLSPCAGASLQPTERRLAPARHVSSHLLLLCATGEHVPSSPT